ncbi:ABC transporter permease subunit [Edaphobacillus lindanitolerans]|uniref:Iron(III) transport system permease protein n=1 Tax=Edaphobacillus lindanitolerans TaxID=550447 RepID=A0A1U7PKE7_9BACI|nr:ABC transporter permease subunit [Edaphobacillus lindanitolerans]SIT72974.1 iron(III) transport system permease protein [Edaphobacillus lindanitolerans]
MTGERRGMRGLYIALIVLLAVLLAAPLAVLAFRSFRTDAGTGLDNYQSVLTDSGLVGAFWNSVKISGLTAAVTTILAFLLGYALHCTRLPGRFKSVVKTGILVPMLLPTITYGFAIIYSYGNQGLMTRLFGGNGPDIYGFGGLLIGYVIYTLPPAFLLIQDAFKYVDRKFILVSKLMGDSPLRSFGNTIVRPMAGAAGGAFVLSFVLSFTDFGIPASIGGNYEVVATMLYQAMLGSIPDFGRGAVIAIAMLLPALFCMFLLGWLERFNFRHEAGSETGPPQNRLRDAGFGLVCLLTLAGMASVFAVMFISPFMGGFPYDLNFTFKHVKKVFASRDLLHSFRNSVAVAILTAVIGTVIAYAAALLSARTPLRGRRVLDGASMVTNAVPGMVLGLAYLMLFSGSPLKGTLIILVLCNLAHFFTTPYLMAKNAFSKMPPSYEKTGELLGDSWTRTVFRVLVPNSGATLTAMFGYYFINSMVTISGVIFLVSADTSLVASKIKELQHFGQFNEIFVLSLLIFFTNLAVKRAGDRIEAQFLASAAGTASGGGKSRFRVALPAAIAIVFLSFAFLGGPGNAARATITIQTNGDEEAVSAMKTALDEAGYEGRYQVQSLGTSELGGKLLAEGKRIDADIVTMSSYFLETAQQEHGMFAELAGTGSPLEKQPAYYRPILALTGSIFINPAVLEERGLPVPESVLELADPAYQGLISIPNLLDSSTGWLLVQAVIHEYGEKEGQKMFRQLLENAGPHLESSGSGPLKKVLAGETAAGFGLRNQAIAANKQGMPVETVDPAEGNFSITEFVAVIDREDEQTDLAKEMAAALIEYGREELLRHYPVPLYEGEKVAPENRPGHPKAFGQPLTVELLESHQQWFIDAKDRP